MLKNTWKFVWAVSCHTYWQDFVLEN